MTVAALFTGAVQLIFLVNLFWSRFRGAQGAGQSRGKPRRSSGPPARRRRSTTSAATTRWSITGRTSTACRAGTGATTSCRTRRSSFRPTDERARRAGRRHRRAPASGWGSPRSSLMFAAFTSAMVVRRTRGGLAAFPPAADPVRQHAGAPREQRDAGARARRAGRPARQLARRSRSASGCCSSLGQVLAWRNLAGQGLFLATNPSSAFFYVFTARPRAAPAGRRRRPGLRRCGRARRAGRSVAGALDAAALYWHFMAVCGSICCCS